MRAAPRRRSSRRLTGTLVALALVVTACSSDGSSGGDTTTTAPAAQTTAGARPVEPAGWEPPSCDRGVEESPTVEPVEDSESDHDIVSFDGTRIRVHWFPREADDGEDSPTVLMGPGWGSAGDTDVDGSAGPGIQSVASIPGLHAEGYNVLTWDPRGFGESEGTVQIDSADFEARDVSVLIDWVAEQDGVELDGPGNPRVGMVGGSYGGGIQFVTAATDCRVDVIAPTIAWNSLATSLYPAETYKAGWAGLLLMGAASAELDEHILSAADDAEETGVLDQADREWFMDRGPDYLLGDIAVPTLIIQGTVDNLFPLSEGVRNHLALANNDIPLAMQWFCGGHGVCDDPPDPDGYDSDALTAWLARYLKRDSDAASVPGFQTTDQQGEVHTFAAYPPPAAGTPAFAFADSGTLELQPDGGSGPLTDAPDDDVIAAVAASITPAEASRALEVPVTVDDGLVVGAPELALGYTCTLESEATRPTRIFAQLVDDATGRVLGNQITPIPIVCDGLLRQAQVSLEPVAYAPTDGGNLTLQLVASTVAYDVPQMDGTVDFGRIELALPTVLD